MILDSIALMRDALMRDALMRDALMRVCIYHIKNILCIYVFLSLG